MFVGNAFDSEELSVAYSSLDSKRYYQEIEAEDRRKMVTAIGHLSRLIPKSAAIIDIGTGNGLFVELLNQAGYSDVSAHDIEGSDLSGIKNLARQVYQDFDYDTIPSDHFDVVTLLDVLEHVPDPWHLIRSCSRILKRGGLLYFHTPIVTKTDRMMHGLQKVPVLRKAGTIWQRGRTSIFHLENYTPRSITGLLRDAGFSDIDIEVKNELSWPVRSYVRVYLLEKQKLPVSLAPLIVPFVYPLLATNFFNANKAIVAARKDRR